MLTRPYYWLLWIVLCSAWNAACLTLQADQATGVAIYATQIKSVFKERCYACHGALKQAGGLRLDTVAFLRQGGDSGPALAASDATVTVLQERITAHDASVRMPLDAEPLTAEQIQAIDLWIAAGAPAPADEQQEADPREHWSFRPLVRPAIPEDNSGFSRNPIDSFIALAHRQHRLTPQQPADDLLLLRRLYIDLLGMVPTADEVASARIGQPQWYEQLVDRLLDDPRYGERWARHWMDIWRYSDWWGLGDQLRNSQYHIWHWRDWLIEAINDDLPYDEMLRQMLAADEIYPEDLNKLRATGYLARNYFLFNRNPWMEETVEHLCKSMIGITMNCAKCHDHKYDPIEQVDFYRMRAIFEPYHVRLDMVRGQTDFARDGIPRVFDALPDVPTYLYERGEESRPDKSKVIQPGVPAILSLQEFTVQPVSLPTAAWQPERRSWVLENYSQLARSRIIEAETALEKASKRRQELVEQVDATVSSNSAIIDAELVLAECQMQVAKDSLSSLQAYINWLEDSDDKTAAVSQLSPGEQSANREIRTASEPNSSSSLTADELTAERSADPRLEAVRWQLQQKLSEAQLNAARAQLELLQAADDKRKAAEEKLSQANIAVRFAQEQHQADIKDDARPSLMPGAQWTPTRFLTSTADDPAVGTPAYSTGRRKALAQWLTDPRHPLTARVAINHIWNRHFGTPLVATIFDFGRNGAMPTHPELLDWLAAELIDKNWSMKAIHRLLVNSATYRLSSSATECIDNLDRDPDNIQWWRRNPIRIESQAVRDSVLRLSGKLDLTQYGPSIPAGQQDQSLRRSLYFFHSNNDKNPFLMAFDEASVKECYRRDQSVVPQQALAMVNSRLVLRAAESIAQQIDATVEQDQQFIEVAFEQLLCARPSPLEVEACLVAVKQWNSLNQSPSSGLSRRMLVWSLLNHNDFVTLR